MLALFDTAETHLQLAAETRSIRLDPADMFPHTDIPHLILVDQAETLLLSEAILRHVQTDPVGMARHRTIIQWTSA